MAIQRSKLNIVKARRRVRMRSALVLTLAAFVVVAFGRGFLYLPTFAAMPRGIVLALETALTVLGFGGGAYLGLCVLDGDHRKIIPLRQLSRAQTMWLALLGALCVCPMALTADLMSALWGASYGQAAQATASGVDLFTARLVKSVLIVPILEELFFRGYLLGALRRYGTARAAIVVSLCFAWVHGSSIVAYALFGLLLCLLTIKTGSLLAPILTHACYNLTLLVLSALGLSSLFVGWSLTACVVKLVGCTAFIAVFKRAYAARGVSAAFVLWEGGRLKKCEKALLAASAVLLILSMILGG